MATFNKGEFEQMMAVFLRCAVALEALASDVKPPVSQPLEDAASGRSLMQEIAQRVHEQKQAARAAGEAGAPVAASGTTGDSLSPATNAAATTDSGAGASPALAPPSPSRSSGPVGGVSIRESAQGSEPPARPTASIDPVERVTAEVSPGKSNQPHGPAALPGAPATPTEPTTVGPQNASAGTAPAEITAVSPAARENGSLESPTGKAAPRDAAAPTETGLASSAPSASGRSPFDSTAADLQDELERQEAAKFLLGADLYAAVWAVDVAGMLPLATAKALRDFGVKAVGEKSFARARDLIGVVAGTLPTGKQARELVLYHLTTIAAPEGGK